MPFLFAPAPMAVVPVQGERYEYFPIHRVYCIAKNYYQRGELPQDTPNAPFFFMKAPDCVTPIAEKMTLAMPYPPMTQRLVPEVELVAALCHGGRNLTRQEAWDAIWGWGVGIDFARRDILKAWRRSGRPWDLGKNFRHASPVSHLRPHHRTPLPSTTDLWLYANNRKVQAGKTQQMIRNPGQVIARLSRYVRLRAGDLIFTGTPGIPQPVTDSTLIYAGINGVGSLKIQLEPAKP